MYFLIGFLMAVAIYGWVRYYQTIRQLDRAKTLSNGLDADLVVRTWEKIPFHIIHNAAANDEDELALDRWMNQLAHGDEDSDDSLDPFTLAEWREDHGFDHADYDAMTDVDYEDDGHSVIGQPYPELHDEGSV